MCVQSFSPSDCESEDMTVSGVRRRGAARRSEGVCVANKRSLRCRGAAGSRAPPERTPCFHQSATAAQCPPR